MMVEVHYKLQSKTVNLQKIFFVELTLERNCNFNEKNLKGTFQPILKKKKKKSGGLRTGRMASVTSEINFFKIFLRFSALLTNLV